MDAPSALVNAFVAACSRQRGKLSKVAS